MAKKLTYKCKGCGKVVELFAACGLLDDEKFYNDNRYREPCEKTIYPKEALGYGLHCFQFYADILTADQVASVVQIEEMSNVDLIGHFGEVCMGNDWDARQCEYDIWEADICEKEMLKRMEKK